ncbi:LacI family DNA-binding transcriptional regulator [Sinomonas flava]|uniref:LacI family DNA-binding transcriptional regulator n=1 Tax=Sinomonas flava TaxID=496857 RepID=UPI0039A70FDB
MSFPAASGRRRPVTQEDVARAVGVSRTLVSFAFRGAPGVSPETRDAILEAARRLGYRHNVLAASLASKRASAVGLYLLDLHNEVYADIFAGVSEALSEGGHRLILGVTDSPSGSGRAAADSLIEARIGVLIAATLTDPDAYVRELTQTVPVVNVARRVCGVDSIYSDDRAGASAAVSHLLGLGHTRIAHMAGPPHEGHLERRRTYERLMVSAGLEPRVVLAQDYTQEAAERAAHALLADPERPTAVFAHNDELALGVREAAYALGLRVPQDLSLIGYDNSRLARLHGIDLTSVDLHARELGKAAGEAALQRLAQPEDPAMERRSEPHLVLRASTSAPARS